MKRILLASVLITTILLSPSLYLYGQATNTAAAASNTDTIHGIPFSWFTFLIPALACVAQFLVKLKDNRTMIALVKSVQAGRQYLASTQGQKVLNEFTSVLQSHQETAGIAQNINKLLDKHVDDVVTGEPAPVIPAPPTQAKTATT